MKNRRLRACKGVLLPLALCLVTGSSAVPGLVPDRSIETFDRAVLEIASACRTAPSTECVGRAWRAADADDDDRLSPDELKTLRDRLDAWVAWKRDDLPPHAGSVLAGGLDMVAAIGVGRLLAAFDADEDGALSRAEAFSDIRLDDRPLGRVLSDPTSVDRSSLARRLARVSPLLGALVRSIPLRQP